VTGSSAPGPSARLFAATWPGLEGVAADEARAAGFADVQPIAGGVNVYGDPLRANRMLAVPNRILQRVARFPAHNFDQLMAGAADVDWSPFGGLTPHVTCRKSRLYHSGAVAERLAAVVPPGPGGLFARLSHDRCTLSVDTTGELAHRRGWRLETGRAPLRETLAAGLLRLAGWAPGTALFDPMCGSGTLPIEAASWASGRWPGVDRDFACGAWCAPTPLPDRSVVGTVIRGADRHAPTLEAAVRNAERAALADAVDLSWAVADARDAAPPAPTGLLICNPPYGRRVRGPGAYGVIGALLAGPFAGWRAAVLCADPRHAAALGRAPAARHHLRNGGLKIDLLVFEPSGR